MEGWESITPEDLRTAARVARASGGVIMVGAAEAWELRAKLIERKLSMGMFD